MLPQHMKHKIILWKEKIPLLKEKQKLNLFDKRLSGKAGTKLTVFRPKIYPLKIQNDY